jgi:hypothetical protein
VRVKVEKVVVRKVRAKRETARAKREKMSAKRERQRGLSKRR